MQVILEAKNITKQFPGVTALDAVSFTLHVGEVHALCGENGAGKSTLIKLLSGIHPHGSFTGELWIDGKPTELHTTQDATDHGIAVIYQELALIDEMTVAENIFLGAEPTRWGTIDWDTLYQKTQALLDQFNIQIDPSIKVGELGIGQKQLVEIIKALSKQSKILILDEPTAALTESDVDILLNIVSSLRAHGVACIYISHKLEEVFSIANRITVLRDGQTIVTQSTEQTSMSAVIQQMVGREISQLYPERSSTEIGKALLKVENLSVAESRIHTQQLQNISFTVHAGEVLGIGGLMGAGRSELLMHLFGAFGVRTSGNVCLFEQEIDLLTPKQSIEQGCVLVSEDRKRYGLVLDQSIQFNLSLSYLKALSHWGWVDTDEEYRCNQKQFEQLRVKAPHQETAVGTLSGGNQQKVVLGKALMTEPELICLDEPTRGIDIGAKSEIYQLINELTAQGKGVILVSSELPELMGLSDRIIMLHEGRIGGRFEQRPFTEEKLLSAAMGHYNDSE